MSISSIFRRLWHVTRYEVDSRDASAYRSNSKRIEEWRNFDFSSAAYGMLASVFKDTNGLEPRYTSLITRISKDGGGQYNRTARRKFLGSGMNGEPLKKVRRAYKAGRVDSALRTAQQKCEPQNSVILSVEMSSTMGVPKVMSWIPGEVLCVEREDPLDLDMRDVDRVELEAPTDADPSGGAVKIGKRVYTKDEAWTETTDGERIPLFGDDIAHGFGRIPLMVVRYAEPTRGQFLPALRLDYLAAQEAECTGLSDMEHIARTQSAGERVLTGPGALSAVVSLHESSKNNDTASALAHTAIKAFDGEDLKYEVINARPDIKAYAATVERGTEIVTRYGYASPEGVIGSKGITGAAKEAERLDMREEQQRKENIWSEAERELLDLIVMVLNASPGAIQIPDGAFVTVDHLYVAPLQNDLQSAQAREIRNSRGAGSYSEDVSRDEGISEPEAWERVQKRLKEYNEIKALSGEATPHGIDKIGALTDPGGKGVVVDADGKPVAATGTTGAGDADATGDDVTVAGKAAVQDPKQSLNGAQVKAMQEIAAAVAANELSAASAQALLMFAFGMDSGTAARIARGG